MNDFTATYSPEDNKLRIYVPYRLDDELYKRFKEHSFRWAPKQELFVAPAWSPSREDFALEMAGTIEAEQTTMIDRATAKAERLDDLASRRLNDSNVFALAADRIAERFAGGQPILVGHHSEKRARKDAESIDRNMRKAKDAREAVNYWNYKAEGVERHANRKGRDDVRERRIKKLLAELRDRQRTLNHADVCVRLWTKILNEENPEQFDKLVKHYVGGHIATGSAAPWDLWSQMDKGKVTTKEAAEKALASAENTLTHPYYHRWIAHLLNRLGFERSELGPVPLFDGEITAAILQEFARNQGALKPKAQIKNQYWVILSPINFPAHLGEGNVITLDSTHWVELMQSVGYTVPNKKATQPPILNFKCSHINQASGRYTWEKAKTYPQIDMTKAEYKKLNGWIMLSTCGTFRFRSGYTGHASTAKRVAVFLTDSKVHEVPDSEAINRIISEVEA